MRSMSLTPCSWRPHPAQQACGYLPRDHHIRTAVVGAYPLHGYRAQEEKGKRST